MTAIFTPWDQPFALIDPLNVEVMPQDLVRQALVPPGLEGNREAMPALVDLTMMDASARDELKIRIDSEITQDRRPLIAVFFHAQASGSDVAAHLEQSLIVRSRENQRHFFRFFDPRVFSQLEWILSREHWRSMLGPVDTWTYWIDGKWRTVTRDAIGATSLPEGIGDRWSLIARLDLINEAISAANPADTAERQHYGRIAARLLMVAKTRFGLTEREDLQLFLRHGLDLHPQFYDHVLVRRPLETAIGEEAAYRTVAASLSTDDYERIRMEVNKIRGSVRT